MSKGRKFNEKRKTQKLGKKQTKNQSLKNTSIRHYNRENRSYASSRSNVNNKNRYRSIQNRRANSSSRKTQNRKKVRNRNIHIISRLFTFILFLVIISYFSISIFKGFDKKPIDYQTIEYGSIDSADKIKGVIIRDEDVYKATKAGILAFNKNENDKVKKDELIVTIKDQEAIKDDEQDIKQLNEKILQIQEQRNELSIFYEDTKKIDSQIQKTLDNKISDLSTYNISKVYELKDNLNKKLTIRNQMLLSENSESLKNLTSQKILKEQKVNKSIENIFSKTSGILSYYTDGLEQTFTFGNKDKLTKEQTIIKTEEDKTYNTSIIQGEPAFKIVKDNNFYIASYIKNEKISSWKEKETRNIYINDAGDKRTLEVIIDKINRGDKESYVIMKTNKNMLDFINKRSISFEINKKLEGFKINRDAILEEELLKIPNSYISGNSIIKKDNENVETKIPIKISEKDENASFTYVNIIPNVLDVGDFIIDPKTKKEIQLNDIFIKKGIYVVNSGIYTFKTINTEGSVEDEQFIIVEPNKNTNIQLYDRYASDLSVVKGEGFKNDR